MLFVVWSGGRISLVSIGSCQRVPCIPWMRVEKALTESMLVGLFSGGVLVRCVANAGTSTSPGTSEPSALDFLLRLAAPFVAVLCGSAPLRGGNGSVIVRLRRSGTRKTGR